jgi:hypothetical protein
MIFYQSGKRIGILQKFGIFITVVKQTYKLRPSKILKPAYQRTTVEQDFKQ